MQNMKVKSRYRLAALWRLLALISAVLASPLYANDEAQVRELLSEMSAATRQLDYSGLFTFEVGGVLDTYRIEHRIVDGKEIERLQRLNGETREIATENNSADCLSPGKKLLHELMADVGVASQLFDNYHFKIQSDQRIAERTAIVVNLEATGNDRYGYSIGIDQATRLPLKIMLIAPNKRSIIERIQFIELNPGAKRQDLDLSAAVAASPDSARADCENIPQVELQGWYVEWLPHGFVFAGQRRVANGDQMLSFTDGLASFSVFVGDANTKPPVREAKAQLGATTVYMIRRQWNQQSYNVTVVGEVPFLTAQKVVTGLKPN